MNRRLLLGVGKRRGMKMMTLPKNLLLSEGETVLDFESLTDWIDGDATIALNTTAGQFSEGSASIKMTNHVSEWAEMHSPEISQSMVDFERLSVWMYDHGGADGADLWVKLSSDLWWDDYLSAGVPFALPAGGYRVDLFKDHFTSAANMDWDDTAVRVQFGISPSESPISISFDDFQMGYRGVSAVMIRFDDGYASQYSEAFAYMRQFGIRGTLAMIGSWIGEEGCLSAAQLLEMNNAGWTIANHTHNHPVHGTNGMTQEQAETEINAGKAALVAIGLSRGNDYFIQSGDGHADATAIAAYQACGVLLASEDSLGRPLAMPLQDPYRVESYVVDSAEVTLNEAKAYIDQAITRRTFTHIYFHGIAESPESHEWSIANFRALIDYIREKCLAGELAVVTMDDIYQLTQGPVDVPVIV